MFSMSVDFTSPVLHQQYVGSATIIVQCLQYDPNDLCYLSSTKGEKNHQNVGNAILAHPSEYWNQGPQKLGHSPSTIKWQSDVSWIHRVSVAILSQAQAGSQRSAANVNQEGGRVH